MKDFTLYPEALELKELGFDEPCFAWYHLGDTLLSDITMGYEKTDFLYTQDDMEETQCTAPTYSQAFRWFRYNYWYYASISPIVDIGNVDFTVEVSQFFQEDRYVGEGDDEEYFPRGLELVHTERFDTYEEAELACLREMIKLVKK
jgi:hypothetical protein